MPSYAGETAILWIQVDHITTYTRIQLPNHLENLGFTIEQPFWCAGIISLPVSLRTSNSVVSLGSVFLFSFSFLLW